MTKNAEMIEDRAPIAEERCDIYFRALFEHSGVGMVITDQQDFIIRANPAFCRMLGYAMQQLQGTRFKDLMSDSTGIANDGEGFSRHRYYRHADGSDIACLTSISALRNNDNTQIGNVALVHELTQEIKLRLELEQQRRELETLLDTLPMPVFFKDKSLRYRRANRAACNFLGLSLDQIIGRKDTDLFPPALSEQIHRHDTQAMVNQSLIITPDATQANARGELHYFSTYISPVLDDAGQIAGVLDLALDVTERKLAESERLTLLQGQRDALVQEVHHRIKNHLQGVVGLLQRAISGNPLLAVPLRGVVAQVESIAGIHGLQSRLRGQCLTFGQVAGMIAELTPGQVVVNGAGQDSELPKEEAVPFALTLNELVSNAFKHRQPETQPRLVKLDLKLQDRKLSIQVRTGPAKLPLEFDFAAGIGLGTGLRLLRTLLPSEGASLHYYQDQDEVVAELQLMPPLVMAGAGN
ncbi:MAG: PAS domain-containing protein [Methylomonas sp.]